MMPRLLSVVCLLSTLVGPGLCADRSPGLRRSFAETFAEVQPKVVKVYGAGGLRNLESYQSGFLITSSGLIVTAWSYVLDTGDATVILSDGRRFQAELFAADPRTELALLKIEAEDLAHFDWKKSVALSPGTRVLAFSNLYGVATGDEPVSVQHGVVSGITTLNARRGAFASPYKGSVYVLDAMSNNAGAAGGALTDAQGRLVGILGKELRDAQTNRWLNYAQPIEEVREVIAALIAGKSAPDTEAAQLPVESASLRRRGVELLPNILRNTPPYVDAVRPDSPAAKAGVRPDDLIVMVGSETISTQATLAELLLRVDALDAVELTVLRDGELLPLSLAPTGGTEAPQ